MKFYSVVFFIFIFNISLALLNSSDAFPANFEKESNIKDINDSVDRIKDFNPSGSEIERNNDFTTAVGSMISGFTLMASTIVQATVFVGPMLKNIFPGSAEWASMADIIRIIIYLIYGGTIIQFVANKSFKTMS